MRNYKIVISFNGEKYKGLTSKTQNGTVAEKLYEVMSRVLKETIDIQFAVDVERGIHGRKIPGSFTLNRKLKDLEGIRRECQQYLPKAIVIDELKMVDDKYQAKHNVKAIIDTSRMCRDLTSEALLFQKPLPIEVNQTFNVDQMRMVANELVGQHDFISFADKKKVKNSTKTIESIDIKDDGNIIDVVITSNSFIKGMGRNIHRLLKHVGHLEEAIDDVSSYVWSDDKKKFGQVDEKFSRIISVKEK